MDLLQVVVYNDSHDDDRGRHNGNDDDDVGVVNDGDDDDSDDTYGIFINVSLFFFVGVEWRRRFDHH